TARIRNAGVEPTEINAIPDRGLESPSGGCGPRWAFSFRLLRCGETRRVLLGGFAVGILRAVKVGAQSALHRPGQRRAAPALLCRTKLGAAVERSHPKAIGRRVSARGRRIERCTAIGAEPVRPLVPAFSSLDVGLWCSALQNKGSGQARHIRTKSGAGQSLTI